jgi:hypothetical protein
MPRMPFTSVKRMCCQHRSTPLLHFALVTATISVGLVPSVALAQGRPAQTPLARRAANTPGSFLIENPPGFPPRGQRVTCDGNITACLDIGFNGSLTGREPVDAIPSELRREIINFPVGASSGGFTFTFVPKTRSVDRASTSFGPSFGDRATTHGRRRLSVGAAYQYHTYANVVGHTDMSAKVRDLDSRTGQIWFENVTRFSLTRHVLSASAVYGLANNFDVYLVAPIVSTRLAGTYERIVMGRPPYISVDYADHGSAIGDLLAGAKLVAGGGLHRFGVVTQIAFATGNPIKLSGLGYSRGTVTAIWSGNPKSVIQPHVNLGLTMPLSQPEFARDFDIDGKEFVVRPKQVDFVAGTELVASPRLTITFDAVAKHALDSAYITYGRVPTAIVFGVEIDDEVRCCLDRNDAFFPVAASVTKGVLAIGMKYNITKANLLSANVLVPFGRYSIQPRPAVNFGVSVVF